VTDLFVSSVLGNDANPGTAEASPKASVFGASGIKSVVAAGDVVHVDANHSEISGTNPSIALGGTEALPCIYRTWNFSASQPAIATTAQLGTTAGVDFTISSGVVITDGLYLQIGRNFYYQLISSFLRLVNSSTINFIATNARFYLGNNSGRNAVALYDSRILNSLTAGQLFYPANQVEFLMVGGSISSATSSVALAGSAPHFDFEFDSVDMSGVGNTHFVDPLYKEVVNINNCITTSGFTISNGAIPVRPTSTYMMFSDSASSNKQYTLNHTRYNGVVSTSDATYRAGGGAHLTTPLSLLLSSNTKCNKYLWLDHEQFPVSITSTGSKTLTLELIHDSVTALTLDDVDAVVHYYASSTSPLHTVATFDTIASSSASWTHSMTNPNTQKISLTVTVNQIGVAFVMLRLKQASKTIYVCPKIEVA